MNKSNSVPAAGTPLAQRVNSLTSQREPFIREFDLGGFALFVSVIALPAMFVWALVFFYLALIA